MSTPELTQVSPHCYYLPGPAKIGIVRLEGDSVCLIDSGNDKSAGKAVRRILDANGWKLSAIYCTHSHADHTGGCRYLQSQSGCSVYAPGVESCIARYPMLEPSYLFGGYPPAALRSKFLLAQECDARPLTPAELPPGFESIPLPGHFFDMVGYRTADDVVYLADALLSRATLEKYRICFLYDIAAQLRTLDMLQSLQAKLFIPAHADATENIADLARYNAEQIHAVADTIMTLCREPLSQDALLRRIFSAYGLTMTFEQHALVGSAVRSYLAWLSDSGRICPIIDDNTLLWHTCS